MACLCCIIFYCTYLFFTCVGRVVDRIHSWSCGGRINFHKFRKHTIGLTIGLVRYVVVWWSRYRRIGNLVVWWSQIGPINDTTNYPRAVMPRVIQYTQAATSMMARESNTKNSFKSKIQPRQKLIQERYRHALES